MISQNNITPLSHEKNDFNYFVMPIPLYSVDVVVMILQKKSKRMNPEGKEVYIPQGLRTNDFYQINKQMVLVTI